MTKITANNNFLEITNTWLTQRQDVIWSSVMIPQWRVTLYIYYSSKNIPQLLKGAKCLCWLSCSPHMSFCNMNRSAAFSIEHLLIYWIEYSLSANYIFSILPIKAPPPSAPKAITKAFFLLRVTSFFLCTSGSLL